MIESRIHCDACARLRCCHCHIFQLVIVTLYIRDANASRCSFQTGIKLSSAPLWVINFSLHQSLRNKQNKYVYHPVGLSADMQSPAESVPEKQDWNPIYSRARQLVSFRFDITSPCQCIMINTNTQLSRFVSEHSVCWRFGVWDPGLKSCIQQRNTICLLSIWISLACTRASKLTTTNMYIARARCESQLTVGSSGLNALWS